MSLNLKKKKKCVLNIKNILDKSLSILIINYYSLKSNDLNIIRKDLRKDNSFIFVVRNSLFKIAICNTVLSKIKCKIFGPIIIFYSFKSYNIPSFKYEKFLNFYKNNLILKYVYINKKIVSYNFHKKISNFYNIKESLLYFIYFLKNISIIRFLNILLIIKNSKLN